MSFEKDRHGDFIFVTPVFLFHSPGFIDEGPRPEINVIFQSLHNTKKRSVSNIFLRFYLHAIGKAFRVARNKQAIRGGLD